MSVPVALKPVVVEPQQAQLTSDAGLLPIRQLDEQLGLTAQFAAALNDPRNPDISTHSFLQMVRMRVYGILSDHRYMANLFRLYLHALAANLLARLRGVVADPPPPAIVTPLPTEGWPASSGMITSTTAANGIRWAKASPAPGGRG